MTSEKTFTAYDPATGQALEQVFTSADVADIERVAAAAAAAFRTYGCSSGRQRAQLLRAIAAGIEGLGSALIELASRETALPQQRITSERGRTCMQLRLFADLAEQDQWPDERVDAADPVRQPQPRPEVRSRLRPLGPVVVFGASNFPLAFSVAGGDTAAALAVGCPVIVKAHSAHPGTSQLVADVIHRAVRECKLPEGVFALVFGAGQTVGQALIRHPAVKAGAFTGSRSGGLALLRAAQTRPEPIPFFAEMSSLNPVFVFPEILQAQAESIAAGLHASMTLGVGQFCTQPGLIFLRDDALTQDFLDKVAERVAQTPPGAMLTATICRSYQTSLQARGELRGIAVRGRAQVASGEARAAAALLVTGAATFLATPTLAEEIFGPASLAVLCKSTDEFVHCARQLEGQLTATVWAAPQELRAQGELLWTLEQKAGRLILNGFPTGVEVGTAMVHGGPFPSTTDSRFTSVGTRSIYRFLRPVAYQAAGTVPPELYGHAG